MAETITKFIKSWFANAEEDLRGAEALHQLDAAKYLHIVPYLCQQAVEKSLQGYLSFKKVKFAKTHDIEILAKLVPSISPDLKKLLDEAAALTTFALQFRYPDAAKVDPTLEDSKFAIRVAKEVCNEILALIPTENPMGF